MDKRENKEITQKLTINKEDNLEKVMDYFYNNYPDLKMNKEIKKMKINGLEYESKVNNEASFFTNVNRLTEAG